MKKFRIYPTVGHSLFCEVIVWPTRKAFVDHLSRRTGLTKKYVNSKGAVFLGIKGDGRKFGEIHHVESGLDIEYATHEIAHAALFWANRVGMLIKHTHNLEASSSEERFAIAVGIMSNQFVRGCNRHGIWGTGQVLTNRPPMRVAAANQR